MSKFTKLLPVPVEFNDFNCSVNCPQLLRVDVGESFTHVCCLFGEPVTIDWDAVYSESFMRHEECIDEFGTEPQKQVPCYSRKTVCSKPWRERCQGCEHFNGGKDATNRNSLFGSTQWAGDILNLNKQEGDN